MVARLSLREWSRWSKMTRRPDRNAAVAMAKLPDAQRRAVNAWRRAHGKPEVR